MTDLVWPNGVRMSAVDWRHISNAEVFPATYGGVQTVSRPGERLGCTVTVRNSTGAERSKLRALSAALRGRANRIYLQDLSYRKRGSFPATELLANPEFSGTTSWTGANDTLTANDGVLRVTTSTGAAQPSVSQTVTVALGIAYVLRGAMYRRKGSSALSLSAGMSDGTASSSTSYADGYYANLLVTANAGTASVTPLAMANSTGFVAGDSYDLSFASLARGALVDGGGNSLLRSDEIDNAAWTSVGLGSVTANARVAPDGTTTAELLNQDTSSSGHYRRQNFTVTSPAQGIAASCCFHSSNRGWAFIVLEEQTGGQAALAFFNLAGSVGTVTSSTNMANARAFMVARGDGWFECYLHARKTNAATTVQARVCAATADNTTTYTGSAEGAIYVWRGSAYPSEVPKRATQTTSAVVAAETSSASAIYVKGLPVSTNGLLLAGDWVEIDKQLKMLTAPLDSDAAGLAYLQVDSPFARSLSDNTPIIVEKPMAKFYLASDVEYPNAPGTLNSAKSDFVFEFEQDLAA